ncbi:MAG: hypothetical protein AAF502_20300 [Bacteroidota bacterium]
MGLSSDLARVHKLVQKDNRMEDGLNAYCPDCDKVFCKTHYNFETVWDKGFNDGSYGTCPSGHKWIIDN